MAYHVVYGREQQTNRGRKFQRTAMTIGFLLCLVGLVCRYWPEGKQLLQTLLIPGNPSVTLEAASVFAQEISSGFSIADAADHFCMTVLEYGTSY